VPRVVFSTKYYTIFLFFFQVKFCRLSLVFFILKNVVLNNLIYNKYCKKLLQFSFFCGIIYLYIYRFFHPIFLEV